MTVRYLDQFAPAVSEPIDETSIKRAVGNRFKQIRLENRLSRNEMAEVLESSRISIAFWEQGKFTPSHLFLTRLREQLDVDLNWLLRTERTIEQIQARETDHERIARIFRRIDAIKGSIRLLILPHTRALIARAIHFAPENHEDAFFDLLETRGSVGFTGHKWVMLLDDGRTEEIESRGGTSTTLSQRLKLVRLRMGLTSHGISGTIGVSQATWLSWVAGREPQFVHMISSLGRMDIDLNWLIAGGAPIIETFGKTFDWEELLR